MSSRRRSNSKVTAIGSAPTDTMAKASGTKFFPTSPSSNIATLRSLPRLYD